MKALVKTILKHSAVAVLFISPLISLGQDTTRVEDGVKTRIANLIPYDQSGIYVFETAKDNNAPFDGLKVRFGAGFTQSFQNLKHENTSTVPANALYKITPGFNTANANLYMDVQLADGIRLNLTSYLSSRHHNETWVKGGFIQFDKLPFKGAMWDMLMSMATIKIGHMEINYGDQHFRRSDGGGTIYNPFVENYIMDEFATEIGGEVYLHLNSLTGMIGMSNGMIKGNVAEIAPTPQDANIHKSPSFYFKGAFDKQLNPDFRLRLAASYYTNNSSGSNTLFGGDRTGSNYFLVLEKVGATTDGNAFSSRFNSGFSKVIHTAQFNAFVKAHGFELFGTYEIAKGRSKSEIDTRAANQFAIEGVYRFGTTENLFLGARYNTVTARLTGMTNDVSIDRTSLSAGWFLTRNILLKAEYSDQKYNDFLAADVRNGGKFHGYVIQAVVGF